MKELRFKNFLLRKIFFTFYFAVYVTWLDKNTALEGGIYEY